MSPKVYHLKHGFPLVNLGSNSSFEHLSSHYTKGHVDTIPYESMFVSSSTIEALRSWVHAHSVIVFNWVNVPYITTFYLSYTLSCDLSLVSNNSNFVFTYASHCLTFYANFTKYNGMPKTRNQG